MKNLTDIEENIQNIGNKYCCDRDFALALPVPLLT